MSTASKQVYVGEIIDVIPIPNADKIEAVSVVCGSNCRRDARREDALPEIEQDDLVDDDDEGA